MKKAVFLACSISTSLFSMDNESSKEKYARYLKKDIPPFECRGVFTAVNNQASTIDNIAGKNLNKIVEINILVPEGQTFRMIPVAHQSNQEGSLMKMSFIIRGVENGRYTLRFNYRDEEGLIESSDKKISISQEAIRTTLTHKKSMDMLAANAVLDGEPHEIFCAPEYYFYKDKKHANQRDDIGATDLLFAAMWEELALAQYIITHGGDVNIGTYAGEYPVHFAAQKSDFEMLQLFLEKGANLFVKNIKGEFPRDYALDKGHHSMVEYIDQYHKDLVASEWKKVAQLAIVDEEEVMELIEERVPPLYYANEKKDRPLLLAFIENGCNRKLLNGNYEAISFLEEDVAH